MMIENSIKYTIEELTKASVYLTGLAEKIQNALTEIGVDCKNSDISIGVNPDGIEPYLLIIPVRDLEDKIFFEYSCGVLYTRHRYIDESGIKFTTGYYDICYSDEETILRIKNKVRRFIITQSTTNKKELK